MLTECPEQTPSSSRGRREGRREKRGPRPSALPEQERGSVPHGTGTAPAQRSKHGTNCPAWWGKGVKWYFCSKIAAQALEKKKKNQGTVYGSV